jgi:hypothetical protein
MHATLLKAIYEEEEQAAALLQMAITTELMITFMQQL